MTKSRDKWPVAIFREIESIFFSAIVATKAFPGEDQKWVVPFFVLPDR